MRIIASQGDDRVARVYVGETSGGRVVEFVESVQPPVPREEKWVLIVSTLAGCPVACPMCDAGGAYHGRLSSADILEQLDTLIGQRYPDRRVPVPKLKVQFARMGDPAYNPAVLEVLRGLPERYDAPGLMPCLSTVAPRGRERFFEELLAIKRELYPGGRFQMQFTLHTTDETSRRRLIPTPTWSFAEMGAWGRRFHQPGDRKIALNFAAVRGYPLEPKALRPHFSPEIFLVKLTPVNPTDSSERNGLVSRIDPKRPREAERLCAAFGAAGYDTILSIGELEENRIGSNCGMYVSRMRAAGSLSTDESLLPGEDEKVWAAAGKS
jgi:23S rRNA (adenine2503-C2)-methyltransferase